MCRLEPFLQRSLVVLFLLGSAGACVPRKVAIEEKTSVLFSSSGLMSRLSPDGFRQNIISSSKTSQGSPTSKVSRSLALALRVEREILPPDSGVGLCWGLPEVINTPSSLVLAAGGSHQLHLSAVLTSLQKLMRVGLRSAVRAEFLEQRAGHPHCESFPGSSPVKPPPATLTPKRLMRKNGWNFLNCAYMVMTFLFVSCDKGD
uniref:epididymal protein 13 n=1 Tax=Jaculus jaculus TaxID=51337 RepID=UPI001E1B583E|nr:epididymal protein 13 [Jaculus jaculus]